MNAIIQKRIPKTDAIINGRVEKAIIPSREYKNNPINDHFVSPATRSTFSKAIHFVLNPTQPKIPFEKRLYSPISNIESTICRVIRRKSRAPSTTSVSDILFISL